MKYIIEGIRNGKLIVYRTYKKKEKLSISKFNERMKLPETPILEEVEEEGWGNEEEVPKKAQSKERYFFPNQVSFLEIELRLVFHTITSEWATIRDSIKLMLPKSLFPTNIVREVAVIDYKELLKYLDSIDAAKYRNPVNSAADIKFSLALENDLYDYNWRIEDLNDSPIQFINDNLKKEREIQGIKDSLWKP